MAMRNQETLLLALLLAQLVIGSLSAPDAGCARKDPELTAIEGQVKIGNSVDPNTKMNPEDGVYKTIGEAIANIPDGNTAGYVLSLKAGAVFREKLFLNKSKHLVTIRSADPRNPATIVWNDTSATVGKDGKPLGVDGSSTLTVESDYFVISGVVIKNDAPVLDNTGVVAPALRVVGTKATVYNCTIDGGHGALYDDKGLHYYKSSTITGTVDFIFGAAKSIYEDCTIFSKDAGTSRVELVDGKKLPSVNTVPGESGFSFKTCTIKGAGPQVYLGRQPGTPFIFSHTEFDTELAPVIYNDAAPIRSTKSGGCFAQYKCFGGGLELTPATDLKYDEAKPFLGTQFIAGESWILTIPPAEE